MTLASVCIAAALSGCSSPAQGTSFQPPIGWKSTPGMFGRLQMWMSGEDRQHRQILMLVRGDSRMTTEQLNASSPSGARGMRDVKRDTIAICGGRHAEHFTGRGEGGTGSNREQQQIEGVTTEFGDAKYLAIYIRPVAQPADAQAESALRSLCPKTP